MSIDKTIAFLGGGNMAEALVKGLIASGVSDADRIIVTDVSAVRLDHLRKAYGVRTGGDNVAAVREAQIIVLAVKPQMIDGVLSGVAQAAGPDKLVVSIAAGVTIDRMAGLLTAGPRVVRVMPNTPALALAGAAGVAAGPTAMDSDVSMVKEIFSAVGRAVVVDEKFMDAVTGLSGSGPAYVFTVIEAMADGGVKAGLARPLALELAAQTVLGSAKMVIETKEHPAKLRDMVTSPGGTTIAGMHELEKGKLRASLMSAVEAATKRSRELGGAAPRKAKKAVKRSRKKR